MTEKSTEEIIDSWFFPSPVRDKTGNPVGAPPEAIQKREELREKWLPLVITGRREAPLVKLTPVYDENKPGWKVETAVRTKPNTIVNKSPEKNN